MWYFTLRLQRKNFIIKSENLAEYYHKINGHLLGNAKLFEIGKTGNITIIRN